MSVITFSREIGSQGRQIAENTAHVLGYHFMDKNSIGSIMEEYGLVEFDRQYESPPTFWDLFDTHLMERRKEMIKMLNLILLALAHHGNMVILGRCGFAVLHDYANVLNVRIQAPWENRVRQAMADRNIADMEQAEAFVKENDKARTDFVEFFYDVKWDTAAAFDLVINTGKIAPETATDWIISTARKMDESQEAGVKTTASIPVDQVLHSVICEELHCSKVHSR